MPTGDLFAPRRAVKKIEKEKAKFPDLAACATGLGVTGNDYARCTDDGQTSCADIFAASLPSTQPAPNVMLLIDGTHTTSSAPSHGEPIAPELPPHLARTVNARGLLPHPIDVLA